MHAATALPGDRALLLARTPERATGSLSGMSDQAVAGSGGSSQPAIRQQGGGGAAAAAAGLITGAQQQESPQFIGVISIGAGVPSLISAAARIDSKQHHLAMCATRAEAAAVYDLALIWAPWYRG